jgi:hypothetical protein
MIFEDTNKVAFWYFILFYSFLNDILVFLVLLQDLQAACFRAMACLQLLERNCIYYKLYSACCLHLAYDWAYVIRRSGSLFTPL